MSSKVPSANAYRGLLTGEQLADVDDARHRDGDRARRRGVPPSHRLISDAWSRNC